MLALIARKRSPHRRLRRLRLSYRRAGSFLPGPPGRPDYDDEAFELIGPGNDRAGDAS